MVVGHHVMNEIRMVFHALFDGICRYSIKLTVFPEEAIFFTGKIMDELFTGKNMP